MRNIAIVSFLVFLSVPVFRWSGLRAEHPKEAKGRGEGRGAAALGVITGLVNWPIAVEDILRRLT